MKLWIARDLDNALYIYEDEPILSKRGFLPDFNESCHWTELNRDKFPEVTYENSPQEVELKLVEKS